MSNFPIHCIFSSSLPHTLLQFLYLPQLVLYECFQQLGGVGKGPSGRYIEVSVLVPHLGTLKDNLWGRAWHCNQ